MAPLAALLVTASAAMIGATEAPAAACSTAGGDHCYGEAYGFATPDLHGASETIVPRCLGAATGQYGTVEMWLEDTSGNWLEVGYAANGDGVTVSNLGPGTWRFWAESKPGSSFVAHSLGHFPPLVSTPMTIRKLGGNQFEIDSGNDTAYSTNNTMAPHWADYGSETTANAGAQTNHVNADVTSSGYIDSGDNAHYGGVPNRKTIANEAPESFAWHTAYSTFNAGTPC
jgi:hypothetical protein